jgi:hypothetical protein
MKKYTQNDLDRLQRDEYGVLVVPSGDSSGHVCVNDHNAAFIARACNAYDAHVELIRDIAAILPVAAWLHPRDLLELQGRLVDALHHAQVAP